MSLSITEVGTLVRYLVTDFAVSQIPGDIYTYGSSSVFTISEPNVISITAVFKNGSALSSGQYSFDSSTLRLTVTATLSVGDTIEIQYTYYPNYSDNEIESYVRAANVYFYPDVTDREKNLIAFVASILMKPDNKTIRLPDITINVPPSLPTREIIAQAIKVFKHSSTGVFDLINTGVAYPSNYYYKP